MKYLLKPYSIYELGQRAQQEDSIYPAHNQACEEDRLFILCDGMGGHDAGNVASQTVCSAMSEYILQNIRETDVFEDDDLRRAIDYAYDALDLKDTGADKKMGTTMTCLKFHSNGCTIAHIGDSRVYHIRPGKCAEDTEILFQTIDHSLVNDLIKLKELTAEEAKSYGQKNVITRAMQSCGEKRYGADIYHTQDIRPGDYFFMCSDGILENMEDSNIQYIFSDRGGDANKKVNMIVEATEDNKDNHSAILIQIEDVVGAIKTKPIKLVEPISDETPQQINKLPQIESQDVEMPSYTQKSIIKPKFAPWYRRISLVWVLVIILGLLCAVYVFKLAKEHDGNIDGEELTITPPIERMPHAQPTKPKDEPKVVEPKKSDIESERVTKKVVSEKTEKKTEPVATPTPAFPEPKENNSNDDTSGNLSQPDETPKASSQGEPSVRLQENEKETEGEVVEEVYDSDAQKLQQTTNK